MDKKGKYKVGQVSDFAKTKGWFFGHFADDELLKSDAVEVALQNISHKKASPQDKHLHKNSVEINIVVSGKIKISINGEKITLGKGEFYIIWPETIVDEVEAEQNTELIVVRSPSVNDKVFLG
jgi:quercetin dioxygenase-like cupin family protein